MTDSDYTFPYEKELAAADPRLQEAQASWLSAIDEVRHLDRKTHHIVRLVCLAAARNLAGVERHARLAHESGATWEELVAAMSLTQPSFGLLPFVEALPAARRGFDAAPATESD